MNSAPTSKLRVKPTTMITINTTSVCFSIKLFFFASLPFFGKLCGDDRFHHRRAPMTGFTSAPYHTSNWTGKRLDFLSLFPSFAPPSRHSQRVGERGKKAQRHQILLLLILLCSNSAYTKVDEAIIYLGCCYRVLLLLLLFTECCWLL